MLKHSDFAKDFSAAARKALLRKGIAITGIQGYSVTYDNGSTGTETAYILNDNDTSRVRSYREMQELIASLEA